jgi:hypothetical protein
MRNLLSACVLLVHGKVKTSTRYPPGTLMLTLGCDGTVEEPTQEEFGSNTFSIHRSPVEIVESVSFFT